MAARMAHRFGRLSVAGVCHWRFWPPRTRPSTGVDAATLASRGALAPQPVSEYRHAYYRRGAMAERDTVLSVLHSSAGYFTAAVRSCELDHRAGGILGADCRSRFCFTVQPPSFLATSGAGRSYRSETGIVSAHAGGFHLYLRHCRSAERPHRLQCGDDIIWQRYFSLTGGADLPCRPGAGTQCPPPIAGARRAG